MSILRLLTLLVSLLFLSQSQLFSVSSLVAASYIPASQCQSLLTGPAPSVCAGVLPYMNVKVNYFGCRSDADFFLSKFPFLWSTLEIAGASLCQQTMALTMCQIAYSPCDPSNATAFTNFDRPCVGTCNTLAAVCPGPALAGLISSFLPTDASIPPPFQAANLFPSNCSAPTSFLFSADSSCIRNSDFGLAPTWLPSNLPQPSCQTYNNPKGICYGVIDYPVFVPPGSTLASMEKTAAQFYPIMFLSPVDRCLPFAARHICSLAFPKCDQGVIAVPTAFPKLECKSSCEKFRSQCPELLSYLPAATRAALDQCGSQLFFNPPYTSCDGTSFAVPGQDDFPTAATFFSATDPTVFSTCFDANFKPANSTVGFLASQPSAVKCPYPLLPSTGAATTNWINHGPCSLPCRSILYSPSEWDTAAIVGDVFSVPSFILNAFMVLTWSIFPEMSKQIALRNVFITHFLFSLGNLMNWVEAGYRIDAVGCVDPTMPADQSNPMDSSNTYRVCIASSVIQFFAVSSGPSWWMFIGVDLYIKIVRGHNFTDRQKVHWNLFQDAVGWGWGFLTLFIELGLKGSGRATVLPECIETDVFVDKHNWAVFVWPLVVRALVGMYCVGAVIYHIFKVSSGINQGNAKKSGWTGLFKHSRVILYWFSLYWLLFFIFLISIYIWFYANDYYQSASEYVECLFTNNGDWNICGDHPAKRPPYGIWILEVTQVVSVGVVTFIVYGTQKKIYVLWYNLFAGWFGFASTFGSRLGGTEESSKRSKVTAPHGSKVGPSTNGKAMEMEKISEGTILKTKDEQES